MEEQAVKKERKMLILAIVIFAIIISALVLLMVKIAITDDSKNNGPDVTDKAQNENDDNVVVAIVDGEKILKGEFDKIYDQAKQSNGIDDTNITTQEQKDNILKFKEQVLDYLIYEIIIDQKIEEYNFDMDKIREDVLAEVEERIEKMAQDLKESDTDSENQKTDEEYLDEARQMLDSQMTKLGYNKEYLIESLIQDKIYELIIEENFGKNIVPEQEIKDYYNEQLISQKDRDDEANTSIILYEPEVARVKHILIGLPDEFNDIYREMISDGKKDEAKEYLKENLELIKPKAEEVLEKAKSNEDFEELIAEYGDDPGMEQRKDGYNVSKGSGFVKSFEEAALGLEKEGDISDLVETDYGYHILKLYEKKPEKIYSLEERKEEIIDYLEREYKSKKFQELLEKWMQSDKVEKFIDKL